MTNISPCLPHNSGYLTTAQTTVQGCTLDSSSIDYVFLNIMQYFLSHKKLPHTVLGNKLKTRAAQSNRELH